jgi:hypothetical protein
MALDPKIASLKAAGTYRFEFDKSQVVSIPANQTRLVVGFSKRGPFNTPVFIPDTAFFKQVYGDIDRNLERKDSFFHRSCLAALERGPILALNLLNLDKNDKINAVRFATSATPEIQSNLGLDYIYSGFYNKDKFWFPSTDDFLTTVNADQTALSGSTVNDLLDITNLGQTPISVIAKKAALTNVLAYQVTVEEWYGAANVPGFLNKDSLISDFFVDIFVIGGNFGGDFSSTTPYSRFDSDPIFQQYFDATQGLKRRVFAADATDTQMANFFNLPEVELQATYTACLIPNFVDLLGNNLFVEKVVNADTATTGLFVTVNENLFSGDILIDGVSGGIDMVGHNIEYVQTTTLQDDINMLSYSGSIVSNLNYCRKGENDTNVENVSSTITVDVPTGGTGVQIQVTNTGAPASGDAIWDAFNSMTPNTSSVVGSFIKTTGLAPDVYVPVISKQTVGTTVTVLLSDVGGILPADFPTGAGVNYNYINEVDIDFTADEFIQANATAGIIGSYGSTIATQFANGTLTDGDEAVYFPTGAGNTSYQSFLVMNSVDYGFFHTGPGATTTTNKIAISDPAYYLTSVRITPYQEDGFVNLTPHVEFSIDTAIGLFAKATNPVTYADLNCLNVQTLKGALNLGIDILGDSVNEPRTAAGGGLFPNQIIVSSTSPEAADLIVGNYLVHDEGSISGHSRLTRINSVVGGLTTTEYSVIPANTQGLLVTCQSDIDVTLIASPAQRKVELYYPIDTWVDYLNIFNLPGFNLLATKHVPNGSNSRQNECLAPILGGTNLYKALTDKETINFRYVVDTYGNGIEANCKAIYTNLCAGRKNALAIVNAPSAKDFKANTDPSFTDLTGGLSSKFISEGGNLSLNPTTRFSLPSATSGGSWGAYYYPFITVRDLGRNISVPPAAYVSNNYILKYENALPWSIVAGVRRGVIGGNGVVGLELNLDQEDRYFLEPFGLNPIVFQSGTGPTIFANKTAQQVPKSALSSINVREVVIYIQDGIDAILKNYLFEFNTAQTRLEIKTLADNFLSTVQNDDGVYDYRNIMDETNNTPEVIDQNVGILDTYIEPVRGMEILVQRTTILRTGAISSGNFQ